MAGYTGEVLHEDSGGHEGDIGSACIRGFPPGYRPNIFLSDRAVAGVAQHVFEQHPYGERKGGQVDTMLFGSDVQVVVGDGSGRR